MILTPNMNLRTPTIGVDSGMTWEQAINYNSGILDTHNHTSGSGVPIPPSGLNMNADLPMQGQNITALRSTRFNAQGSPLAGVADLGCLYVSGVDLYFNDENGNQIQMTSGGSVNATSSGISSGTATASFSASILVVNSASNTPASIKGGSVLIGNTGTSGSNYITLSPPNILAANYSVFLPVLPAQTNVMTLDASGNMASITYDQVGQNMTVTGANAIAATMTNANFSGKNTQVAGSDIIVSNINPGTNGLCILRGAVDFVFSGGGISSASASRGEGFNVNSNKITFVNSFLNTDAPVIHVTPQADSPSIALPTPGGVFVLRGTTDFNNVSSFVIGFDSGYNSFTGPVRVHFIVIGQRA